MRIVRSLAFDAEILSARLVGSVARVVTTSSMPQTLPFIPPAQATPDATAAALAHNRDVVRTSKIGAWLPRYRIKGRRGETLARRSLVDCRDVRRPTLYSGLGLLTVLTIDLGKGLALTDSDSIVADGRTVYASQKSLYVATQRWFAQPVTAGTTDPPKVTTAIHKFDISDPDATVYRGSGTVSGYLMNQWSLSEQDGVLRVASTEEPTWWNPGPQEQSESFVTTLKEQGGALVQLGRVGGLGKGERVYAVRFSGDMGFVVTFRRIDPLYTLDLSNPARPAVLGELKIQGYSAYLHPLGGDLLLGIGQDASAEGRVLGTQLSLFDVSDLRRPARLQSYTLGSAWSEAENDHHAFLWWQPSRLAVLPVQAWADKPFVGAVGLTRRAGRHRRGRSRDARRREWRRREPCRGDPGPALPGGRRHPLHGLGPGREGERPLVLRGTGLGRVPGEHDDRHAAPADSAPGRPSVYAPPVSRTVRSRAKSDWLCFFTALAMSGPASEKSVPASPWPTTVMRVSSPAGSKVCSTERCMGPSTTSKSSRSIRCQRGDLQHLLDPASEQRAHLAMTRADAAVAGELLHLEQAGLPLRQVVRVGDKGEDVGDRPVDDERVLEPHGRSLRRLSDRWVRHAPHPPRS